MVKPKLAIFINTLEVAGSEKVVALLINHFYTTYDIHLILLHKIINYELPLNEITVKAIGGQLLFRYNPLMNLLKIPVIAFRLKKYLLQQEIGTCFCILNRPSFIGGLIKIIGWEGRVLASIRTHTTSQYPNNKLSGKIGRLFVRRLLNKADIILPNSLGIQNDLIHNFQIKSPCQVISNPIDLARHQRLMAEPVQDVSFEKFTFVHVGRFEKGKNQALLLKAIQLIKDQPFRLLLIGYGPMESKLLKMIAKFNIEDKIIFLGYREADHVAKYIAQGQAFVMTSQIEGFPNVLLEALACGVPVISTDCNSGPREILTSSCHAPADTQSVEKAEYGILVPINDAKALAAAMHLLLTDPALCKQYAAKAKERSADFDMPIIIKQYDTLFKKMIK